ncbi:hypothetical protein WG66_006092, partial [Moniliophthora roreri]
HSAKPQHTWPPPPCRLVSVPSPTLKASAGPLSPRLYLTQFETPSP